MCAAGQTDIYGYGGENEQYDEEKNFQARSWHGLVQSSGRENSTTTA
jgi:hypothetical protein